MCIYHRTKQCPAIGRFAHNRFEYLNPQEPKHTHDAIGDVNYEQYFKKALYKSTVQKRRAATHDLHISSTPVRMRKKLLSKTLLITVNSSDILPA